MKYIDLLNRFWEANRADRFTTAKRTTADTTTAEHSTAQPATHVAKKSRVAPRPFVYYDIEAADKYYLVDIPKEAYHIFANAISLTDTEEFAAGILDMQKTTMLLFARYIDTAISVSESHGGGGSTPSSG